MQLKLVFSREQFVALALLALVPLAACGSPAANKPVAATPHAQPGLAPKSQVAPSNPPAVQNNPPRSQPTTSSTEGALSSTLDMSAGGDIPDNATFLTYRSKTYSLQYVEGWAQEQLPNEGIRIADKDSSVTVTLQNLPSSGPLTTYANGVGVTESSKEFEQFVKAGVKALDLPAGHSALLTFKGLSAPDPVTNKRVTLDIDRYYIAGPRYLAVLTEATPSGVDNVDAFLQIAKSFAWSGQ